MVDGDAWADFDLSDDEEEDHIKKRRRQDQARALPGVKLGDTAKAYSKQEFHCWDCNFSADGKELGIATSHGVQMYKIDLGTLSSAEETSLTYGTALERFVPAVLTKNVNVPAILDAVEKKDMTKAMILALALNDAGLLLMVYEKILAREIPNIVASIGAPLLPTLIHFLAASMHPTLGTKHIELHMIWLESLLDTHMMTLVQWTSGGQNNMRTNGGACNLDPILERAKVSVGEVQALLLQCLQQVSGQYGKLAKVFEKNTYALSYLANAPVSKKKTAEEEDAELLVEE